MNLRRVTVLIQTNTVFIALISDDLILHVSFFPKTLCTCSHSSQHWPPNLTPIGYHTDQLASHHITYSRHMIARVRHTQFSTTKQVEASAFFVTLSLVDRSFAALKETQIFRILRGIHQNLVEALDVVCQVVSTTAKGIPSFLSTIFAIEKARNQRNSERSGYILFYKITFRQR